ncbi:hypothetical protein B7R87_01560 [Streptomyces tsukubensis]|uniref:Secreted protein n=1 Tax=Streptomyces tsukubensis (strain DSM 42081 / NBRC 108919 / NRRL 18488 / 9993) TaxID=1114943 RepID=A0A7G3ULE5_STRT9|nr:MULTISPECIES: hypothetical protein [Streptomyces]AZK92728.1 hypothetical protein B7R87_01560 [Streptomyces tsukubensis]QKM71106.1 hypothetical protein STSU_032335 [Streptomyces tsukubensis NRRL18488]TAI41641.1 hypothetical protein EWI31_25090 [Streptomyces tsukubensis]
MEKSKRGFLVPPALLGFVVLLVVLTGVSYAAGRMAGPVAPGMHRTDPASEDSQEPGMPGMHGLGPADREVRVGR